MKVKSKNSKGKSIFKNLKFFIKLFTFCFLLLTFLGCDAFVRKFTRKSKKDNLPVEEMVVAPEEYVPAKMTKEEVYRQYLLYWKSWHDELIESLRTGISHKKQIQCADEAIKNLTQLKPLLKEKKLKILDSHIIQLRELRESINRDVYSSNANANRGVAEKIKRNILRDLSYQKIKEYLS